MYGNSFYTDGANLPLVFAPESGNMLGGTIVSISGPCFQKNDQVKCHFDTQSIYGSIINYNRAVCIQPYIKAEGPVRFSISINGRTYDWKGKYYVGELRSLIKSLLSSTSNDICFGHFRLSHFGDKMNESTS